MIIFRVFQNQENIHTDPPFIKKENNFNISITKENVLIKYFVNISGFEIIEINPFLKFISNIYLNKTIKKYWAFMKSEGSEGPNQVKWLKQASSLSRLLHWRTTATSAIRRINCYFCTVFTQ